MLANPLEIRGRHRVNNMNPEAVLEAEGWGNSIIEAYTGNRIGHRAVRTRLKVDITPVTGRRSGQGSNASIAPTRETNIP